MVRLALLLLLLLPASLPAQTFFKDQPKPPPGIALPSPRQRQPLAAGPTIPAGTIRVAFDPAVQREPFTGRVYVAVMLKGPWTEPRYLINDWFNGPQIFAKDVKDVPPGGSVTVDAEWMAFPRPLAQVKSTDWCLIQAVARRNTESPVVGVEGDLYSTHAKASFGNGETGTLDLRLSEVWEPRPLKESPQIKLVDIVSPSLSAFYGHEVRTRAAVVLPEGWADDPSRHYPTIYFLVGFGMDHLYAPTTLKMTPRDAAFKDVIWVVPDPSTPLGHSGFADSANNGPRESSLMSELIPAVESRYHGAGSGEHRYVAGMLSGAWGALWLQVRHPEDFAGCWAHCPDPVDFSDFQGIDLGTPGVNMYRDPNGNRRPFARVNGEVRIWYDDFVRFCSLLGRGNEIGSWESVFGPRGSGGAPEPLFDRSTGTVNAETARAWEKYDLRRILERGWAELGPKLRGKLHIYAGGADYFYMDASVARLRDALQKLGSDAHVEIVPKMGRVLYRPGIDQMFRTIAEREGLAPARSPGAPPGGAPPGPEKK